MDAKGTLMGLMSFLLEEKDLSGTNMERRIDQIVAQGSKAAQTYNLKSTTGKFDQHRAKYNEELLAYIQDGLADHLYYFGYANVEDNPTGFFEFPDHTPERLASHMKFREDSQAALDKVTGANYTPSYYTHNSGEGLPVFDEEDLRVLLDPAYAHARKTIDAAKQAKEQQ